MVRDDRSAARVPNARASHYGTLRTLLLPIHAPRRASARTGQPLAYKPDGEALEASKARDYRARVVSAAVLLARIMRHSNHLINYHLRRASPFPKSFNTINAWQLTLFEMELCIGAHERDAFELVGDEEDGVLPQGPYPRLCRELLFRHGQWCLSMARAGTLSYACGPTLYMPNGSCSHRRRCHGGPRRL